ncbi:PREDICTED: uncharacterized protein LOC105449066 [Wasmannia auropunctata]|uniref:uncharacterized protein LOC105449066 n=1 Tax=Wasmannia auropunctata TaxID=64793 RepID=UPI0005EFEB23|nr:PREDICTED: uncharacterized protein LOC105449066 [Wasmannia auropunctata]
MDKGSISDGGVWANSILVNDLEHGKAKLPLLKMPPGSDINFPHVFVADEAFPLKSYLMRPQGAFTETYHLMQQSQAILEDLLQVFPCYTVDQLNELNALTHCQCLSIDF